VIEIYRDWKVVRATAKEKRMAMQSLRSDGGSEMPKWEAVQVLKKLRGEYFVFNLLRKYQYTPRQIGNLIDWNDANNNT
jgi:hypothetical protein